MHRKVASINISLSRAAIVYPTVHVYVRLPRLTRRPSRALRHHASQRTRRVRESLRNSCFSRVNVTGANQFSFLVLTALLLVLCNPVGGVGNGSNASISASLPSPSAFVGGAPVITVGSWSNVWLGMGMVGFVACLLN